MSTGIDTRVDGDAASVRVVATWLRDRLAPTLDEAVRAMDAERSTLDSGWDGPASDAACAALGSASGKAADMADAARAAAVAVDGFAADLDRVRHRMAQIRDEARAAGLTVVDDVVVEPLTVGADAAAYLAVQSATDAARAVLRFATIALANAWADVKDRWFLHVADLVVIVWEATASVQATALAARADRWSAQTTEALAEAHAAPPGSARAEAFRTYEWTHRVASRAGSLATAAEAARVARVPARVGAGLTVLGVALDLADGKPVVQTLTTASASVAASVVAATAAGAICGSVVPVGGTAVGAFAGLVAGIAVAGGVDAAFVEGLDGVVDGGIDAVGDALEVAGDAVEVVGEAIGGVVGAFR